MATDSINQDISSDEKSYPKYYKNHQHPTIFDEYACAYEGLDGTMVMFPSQVLHHVEPQTVNKERITLAFNIVDEQGKTKYHNVTE